MALEKTCIFLIGMGAYIFGDWACGWVSGWTYKQSRVLGGVYILGVCEVGSGYHIVWTA
ncbi:hypothetical protein F5144DRAFT_573677 [Chaetomium tenue]|uniref:Uncharacterized protein n=1 Tax=Chaetomium tenue TaxID=1854479 RepID=A0ACB7PDP2_9PEZI|nr:hypothetical protein F5144DRAFT_573677 [Chaetomium globosum]